MHVYGKFFVFLEKKVEWHDIRQLWQVSGTVAKRSLSDMRAIMDKLRTVALYGIVVTSATYLMRATYLSPLLRWVNRKRK
jgi:hypothetical protein